jgi:molecular chaperone DnaK
LKAAHAASDIAAIDVAMEKLNAAWQSASQDMYNSTQQEGGDNTQNTEGATNEGANTGNGSTVEDATYEEVK